MTVRNTFVKVVLLAVISVCIPVFFGNCKAVAGKITEYSADQVSISTDNKEKITGKIFVAPDMMRMEMTVQGMPKKMITITRQDTKKLIMMMPDRMKFYEKPLTEDDMQGMMAFTGDQQNVEELGTETVNGYKCKKQRMTTTSNVMGQKITSTMTVWMADEFDFPVKSMDEKGNVTELRNIKKEKLSKDLFEAPKEYQKVNNMMEMMMP